MAWCGGGDFFVEEEACGAVLESQMVDDSMLTIFLLFICPSELSFWPFTSEAESRLLPSVMDWQFVQKRFPWGVWTVLTWAMVISVPIPGSRLFPPEE